MSTSGSRKPWKHRKAGYHDYYIFKEGTEIPNNWRSIFGRKCVGRRCRAGMNITITRSEKKQPDLNWGE